MVRMRAVGIVLIQCCPYADHENDENTIFGG
jgi:hypothetical protein